MNITLTEHWTFSRGIRKPLGVLQRSRLLNHEMIVNQCRLVRISCVMRF